MTQVATAPHECKGHLYHVEHGLRPYWALTRLLIDDYDGHGEIETTLDGETWTVELAYQKSGFAPRPQDDVDTRLYEVNITAKGYGERKVHFNLSPRFPEMEHYETGDRITHPFDEIEPDTGLDVHFQGSNLEPDEYRDLLPRFAHALADGADTRLRRGYLRGRVHALSNIYEYERYVRITREMNKKLIGRGGVMQKLTLLLADEKGTRAEYSIDNEDVIGKHHAVKLKPSAVEKLLPRHRRGRQIKSYLPNNPESFDADDDLYHPKVGVLLRRSLNDGDAFDWGARDELTDRIDETIINTLAWSDVPFKSGGTTFVSDRHFRAAPTDESVPVYDDPTPEIEADQDHVLVTALREMTDADEAIVGSLVTDGGEQHPAELAESSGTSLSTVYRALQRLDGVLDNDDASVRFTSRKIAEEVQGIVESTEYQLDNAADRIASLLNTDARQAASSAFQRWADRYGAEVELDGDDMTIRIGTILSRFKSADVPQPILDDVLDEMIEAWSADGRDVTDLRDATVRWRHGPDGWEHGLVRTLL